MSRFCCICQLFPDLEKVVLLDDDIVVQHDLSSLWEIDLNHNVLAAVLHSATTHTYKDYFNFTQPIISSNLDQNLCAWLPGMNLFNLTQWRNTNITATYHHWLKLVSTLLLINSYPNFHFKIIYIYCYMPCDTWG